MLGLVAGVFLCWAIGAVLLYVPGRPSCAAPSSARRSSPRSTTCSRRSGCSRSSSASTRSGCSSAPGDRRCHPRGPREDPDVVRASKSVVRVTGIACGLGLEGSGWVVKPGLVVTNAHVVAGIERPRVDTAGGRRSRRRSSHSTSRTTSPCCALRASARARSRSLVRSVACRSHSSATRGTGRSRARPPASAEPPMCSAGTRTAAARSDVRSRRSAVSWSPEAPVGRA